MIKLSLLVFFLLPAISYPLLLVPLLLVYAFCYRGVSFFSDTPYFFLIIFCACFFTGCRFFINREYSALNFFEYYRVVFFVPFLVVTISPAVAMKVSYAIKVIAALNFCFVVLYYLMPNNPAIVNVQNILSAESFSIQNFPSIAFRNTGVFRNPAEHAMIMFCFVVYFYLELRRRPESRVTLVLLLSSTLALISAQVKSAYVVLPLVFILIFLFRGISFQVDRKLLLLLSFQFLGLMVLIQVEVVYQLTKLVAIVSSGRLLETSSVVHRFEIWDGGFSLFRTPADLFFGVGRHNINSILGTVDNDILYFLFSFGVLVSVVFSVVIIRFVVSVIRRCDWKHEGSVILAMWVCLLIAGILQGVLTNPKIAFIACIVNLLIVSDNYYGNSSAVDRKYKKTVGLPC